MCRKSFLISILIVAMWVTGSRKIGAQDTAFAVAQAYALHKQTNGVEGTLQLLIDTRLNGRVQDDLWGKGDWSLVFLPGSKLHDELATVPPYKAKLKIVESDGKTITERELGTPLARMKAWNPESPTHDLFLLSEDYSAGFGSYSGPVTTLLRVSDASFHDVEALNTQSQQDETIRLMKSLKSDWQSRDVAGNQIEILSVSCKSLSDGNFVIDYVRYSLDKGQWLEYRREVPGFWESDEPFPDRSAFP